MEYQNIRTTHNSVFYRLKREVQPRATIIFIHGFPFNSSIWDNQMAELPWGIQGIAYDIRGYGESPTDHQFFSVDLFAYDLIDFIKVLGLQNCVLCGISMGGYIALRAFELAREQIAGLVLCDTNCTADTNATKIKRFASISKIVAGGKNDFTEAFLQDVFSGNTKVKNPQVVEFLRQVITNTSDQTICSSLLALASRTDTSESLAAMAVPVLIIRGEEDKLMSQEQTSQLIAGIADSEFVSIAQSGHLPNLENPKDFNRSLNAFLSKHFSS